MLNGKRILVVEDSRTMRLQIKMILEREGVIITEAGSEWGMINKIEEYGTKVDLIIMDLVLNYEDGLDLIKKLHDNPKYKDIPVMIITEKADVEHILRARDLGVKQYLRKPIIKGELISRLNNILDRIPPTMEEIENDDTEKDV